MNFCDTLCCFSDLACKNPGEFPINYSKYHKVCQTHINYISDLESLTCFYCKSKCKIVTEIFMSAFQHKPKRELCFVCKENERYNENTNLCYNCYAYRRCTTCNHATTITNVRECGHHFCNVCESKCFLCYQICNVCFNESEDILKYECQHFRCKNCAGVQCGGCFKGAICEICGKNEKIEANIEGRFICMTCENFDKPKEKMICSNCDAEGNILTRDCSHTCCSVCLTLPCKLCIKSQVILSSHKTIENQEKQLKNNTPQERIPEIPQINIENPNNIHQPCPNCNENNEGQLYKMYCEHDGCSSCYNSRKCKACSKEKCINCWEKPQTYFEFICNHKPCWSCLKSFCHTCNPTNKKSNCQKCESKSSGLKRSNDIEHICKHALCLSCLDFNLNCKTCELIFIKKKNNSCDFCYKTGNLSICLDQKDHFLCKTCFKKCPICSEICPLCSNKLKVCPNESCSGLVCPEILCLNHKCTPCKQKNINIRACDNCLTLKITSSCKNCSKAFCNGCKSTHICNSKCFNCSETSVNKSTCSHPYCEACLTKLNYICSICNSNESPCSTCYNKGFTKLRFDCNHFGCNNCKKNKKCLPCTLNNRGPAKNNSSILKDCINCGKTGNIQGDLLCGHSVCEKCSNLSWVDLNYYCIQCACQDSIKSACLQCKSNLKFEFSDKVVYKTCCQYYLCLEHSKKITGASCEFCLEHQEPSNIKFKGLS